MAKFISNSIGTKAVRLEQVIALDIVPVHPHTQGGGETIIGYELRVRTDDIQGQFIVWETGETLGAVQALAGPIMTALES
jgi:hypothetical protein